MDNNLSYYQEELKSLQDNYNLRYLKNYHIINHKIYLDSVPYDSFLFNDYLSLSNDINIKKYLHKIIDQYHIGGLSSRLIGGNHNLYYQLENKISKYNNLDRSLIYGSGYLANIGVISSLAQKNDLILIDKLCHNSIINGCKLSGAKFLRFKHNDYNHLESLIKLHKNKYNINNNKIFIISETIFSMDGDLSDISILLSMAQKYNSFLIMDNSHGLAIYKINPELIKKYLHLYIQIGTFSKAGGCYGGYVSSNEIIINYLINKSSSLIYSTSLPPVIIAANMATIDIIANNNNISKKIIDLSRYFCEQINKKFLGSNIIIIEFDNNQKLLEFYNKLLKEKILISVIRKPTANTPRARITICNYHNKDIIDKLANLINKFKLHKYE